LLAVPSVGDPLQPGSQPRPRRTTAHEARARRWRPAPTHGCAAHWAELEAWRPEAATWMDESFERGLAVLLEWLVRFYSDP
jgi:hypothetical protein